MNVEDVMQKDVGTCGPEDRAKDVAKVMWDRDCGIVPVVTAERRLLGVVSDRDLLMGVLSNDADLAAIPVERSMACEVRTVRPQDDIEVAHRKMREHRIRRLPVVDDRKVVVGILSLNDIALKAKEQADAGDPKALHEVGETLASICRHRELAAV